MHLLFHVDKSCKCDCMKKLYLTRIRTKKHYFSVTIVKLVFNWKKLFVNFKTTTVTFFILKKLIISSQDYKFNWSVYFKVLLFVKTRQKRQIAYDLFLFFEKSNIVIIYLMIIKTVDFFKSYNFSILLMFFF